MKNKLRKISLKATEKKILQNLIRTTSRSSYKYIDIKGFSTPPHVVHQLQKVYKSLFIYVSDLVARRVGGCAAVRNTAGVTEP